MVLTLAAVAHDCWKTYNTIIWKRTVVFLIQLKIIMNWYFHNLFLKHPYSKPGGRWRIWSISRHRAVLYRIDSSITQGARTLHGCTPSMAITNYNNQSDKARSTIITTTSIWHSSKLLSNFITCTCESILPRACVTSLIVRIIVMQLNRFHKMVRIFQFNYLLPWLYSSWCCSSGTLTNWNPSMYTKQSKHDWQSFARNQRQIQLSLNVAQNGLHWVTPKTPKTLRLLDKILWTSCWRVLECE